MQPMVRAMTPALAPSWVPIEMPIGARMNRRTLSKQKMSAVGTTAAGPNVASVKPGAM
ncbi:hypothetical protein D3C83_253610 [compost metagenome]